VTGGHAYMADGNNGLQIVDVTDPANLTLSGSYATADYARDIYVANGFALVAQGASGLQIIDITDPADPTLSDSYDSSGFAYSVYAVEGFAYLADGNNGLLILKILSVKGDINGDNRIALDDAVIALQIFLQHLPFTSKRM